MMLAYLQFRLTLTQGTGPNLSSPPAAVALKGVLDKLILKDLLHMYNCILGESPLQDRAHVLAGTGLSD